MNMKNGEMMKGEEGATKKRSAGKRVAAGAAGAAAFLATRGKVKKRYGSGMNTTKGMWGRAGSDLVAKAKGTARGVVATGARKVKNAATRMERNAVKGDDAAARKAQAYVVKKKRGERGMSALLERVRELARPGDLRPYAMADDVARLKRGSGMETKKAYKMVKTVTGDEHFNRGANDRKGLVKEATNRVKRSKGARDNLGAVLNKFRSKPGAGPKIKLKVKGLSAVLEKCRELALGVNQRGEYPWQEHQREKKKEKVVKGAVGAAAVGGAGLLVHRGVKRTGGYKKMGDRFTAVRRTAAEVGGQGPIESTYRGAKAVANKVGKGVKAEATAVGGAVKSAGSKMLDLLRKRKGVAGLLK